MGAKTCNQPPTYRLRPSGGLRVPIAVIFLAAFLMRVPSLVSHDYTRPAAAAFFFHSQEKPMNNSRSCEVASPPKPSVPAASDSIGTELSELEESISNLNARLASVLRTEPAEPAAQSPGPDRANAPCEHAEHLTQHVDRIGKCVNNLAALKGRLEI